MFKLVVVGTIAAMAAASHPINEDIVKSIRAKTSLWESHDTETNPLNQYTHEQLLGMLGTYIVPSNKQYPESEVTAVPDNFDSRTQWPGLVHAIRDQQQCGSCWAFGASEALSDRFAIASNGRVNAVLSPEDLVSCDTNDYGCNGGYMDMAWEYMDQHGIVTDACFPYTAGSGRAPACSTSSCKDGSKPVKFQCVHGSVRQSKGESQIRSEIYQNGPVEAAFTVYEDFFNYKSGIYHHVSGGVAGGHAIKLVGFGVENGTHYWLAANSWGTGWGMQGLFKIQYNDCGIMDQVFSCTPNLSGH
jgi:cathepsin B